MRSTARPIVCLLVVLAACTTPAASELYSLQLRTLNDSGVTGSVTFTPADDGRTLVTVDVDAAGHPNMPAHIHPGTCDELTPQPKYPLQNVVDGHSSTEVPATLGELRADTVALNIHRSNSEMDIYTACVEIE